MHLCSFEEGHHEGLFVLGPAPADQPCHTRVNAFPCRTQDNSPASPITFVQSQRLGMENGRPVVEPCVCVCVQRYMWSSFSLTKCRLTGYAAFKRDSPLRMPLPFPKTIPHSGQEETQPRTSKTGPFCVCVIMSACVPLHVSVSATVCACTCTPAACILFSNRRMCV